MVKLDAEDGVLEVPATLDDVNALLKRRGQNSARIAEALAEESTIKLKAASQRAAAVKVPKLQNALIDEMIAQYVTRRRKGLLGKFGRTITLAEGVIKVRVIRRSVELPADATPVVNWLLNHRSKKKLRIIYEVDKASLLASSTSFIRKLHPLGVWVGKHENITVQANSEEGPTIISHRRFPRLRRQ